MKIYTRAGDDGTTGLLYGGRAPKDAPVIAANGAVDEAQAALGVARAEATPGSELDILLVGLERDLYVLMAELATAPANRHKLTGGTSLVTESMVAALEATIDELTGRFPMVTEFVIPGHDRVSAALDVARTLVRRAERAALGVAAPGSWVVPYLNRSSDLVWTMARWQEHGESLRSRTATPPDAPPDRTATPPDAPPDRTGTPLDARHDGPATPLDTRPDRPERPERPDRPSTRSAARLTSPTNEGDLL